MPINPPKVEQLSDPQQSMELTGNADLEPIPEPTRTRYESYRESQLEPLDDMWDASVSLSTNLSKLIRESTILPYADIQVPLICAYTLIPSAMATIVPVLFLWGSEGSGKSSLGSLICGVHNTSIIGAATTYAAVRTEVNNQRWLYPQYCQGEQNYCLVFDNVNRETLQNENLYTFFLNGYNRKTDVISISSGTGTNTSFRVFGTKVISSIYPLFAQSRYAELNRRTMVVKCKKIEKMSLAELQLSNPQDKTNITNRFDPDAWDLSILNQEFKSLWETESNLIEYSSVKRELSRRKKSFTIPAIIDGTKWTVAVDLIATGIVTGIWQSIEEAVEFIASYWHWHKLNVMSEHGATYKILQDFIIQETQGAKELNEKFGYEAIMPEISPEKLKKHVTWASSQGMLDLTPTPATIADVMGSLGWKLDKGTNNHIYWIPTTQ